MNNPIMDLIQQLPKNNTAGLLQMAMSIKPAPGRPVKNRSTRDERQSLLYGLTRGATSGQTAVAPADTTQDTTPADMTRSGNRYGVSDKLWSTVSPLINTYGLSVIEGYRDPATASDKSAKNSQHYMGNALDLNYSALPPAKRRQLLRQVRNMGLSTGIGRNTLHVDLRPGKFWFYDNSGNWSGDRRFQPDWSQGLL